MFLVRLYFKVKDKDLTQRSLGAGLVSLLFLRLGNFNFFFRIIRNYTFRFSTDETQILHEISQHTFSERIWLCFAEL